MLLIGRCSRNGRSAGVVVFWEYLFELRTRALDSALWTYRPLRGRAAVKKKNNERLWKTPENMIFRFLTINISLVSFFENKNRRRPPETSP